MAEGEDKNVLSLFGSLVNRTRLLLALALFVIEAASMPLLVQLNVISLRLFFNKANNKTTEIVSESIHSKLSIAEKRII